jgi:hypothetical protein
MRRSEKEVFANLCVFCAIARIPFFASPKSLFASPIFSRKVAKQTLGQSHFFSGSKILELHETEKSYDCMISLKQRSLQKAFP